VVGCAQAAGVLHRAADPEREVQLRVDHHAGGADLALVGHPAAVGDHAGGAGAGAECGGHTTQLSHPLAAVEAGAATDDARRLGQIHRGRVGRQHGGDSGVDARMLRCRDRVDLRCGQAGLRSDAADVRLQGGDEALGRSERVQFAATVARQVDALRCDLRGARVEGSVEQGGQPWCQVAAVGRAGQQHGRLIGQDGGERRGPCCGLEGPELDEGDVGGDSRQLIEGAGGFAADEHGTPGALGHGLRSARGQLPVSNHHHCDHPQQITPATAATPHRSTNPRVCTFARKASQRANAAGVGEWVGGIGGTWKWLAWSTATG
jgi:hypothetical protein